MKISNILFLAIIPYVSGFSENIDKGFDFDRYKNDFRSRSEELAVAKTMLKDHREELIDGYVYYSPALLKADTAFRSKVETVVEYHFNAFGFSKPVNVEKVKEALSDPRLPEAVRAMGNMVLFSDSREKKFILRTVEAVPDWIFVVLHYESDFANEALDLFFSGYEDVSDVMIAESGGLQSESVDLVDLRQRLSVLEEHFEFLLDELSQRGRRMYLSHFFDAYPLMLSFDMEVPSLNMLMSKHGKQLDSAELILLANAFMRHLNWDESEEILNLLVRFPRFSKE